MPANESIEEKPISPSQLPAALGLFVIVPLTYLIMAIVGASIPPWVGITLGYVILGGIITASILAIIKGLPRWSPPYLGFLLTMGIFLSRYDRIWGWIYPFFIQSFGPRSHWATTISVLYSGIFTFITLFSILISALILVTLLRLLPITRGVWQSIRADWTQLSFMFYGGLVYAIMIAFEEYRHDDLWRLIAWFGLALGAWFYIRAREQKQRILALIGGATVAMWTVALAKWVLIPLQAWPTGYPVSPSEATRWVETSVALIGWVFILIILIAPAALNWLPWTPSPVVAREEEAITA